MLSLQTAAALMGAQLQAPGESVFTRVTTDSRDVRAGDLFVALQGERFDGHAFIAAALAQGAVAVVSAREVPLGVPGLVVRDTRHALADLAAGWRRRFELPVVAVAGSNGKTTVKEMIAAILGAAFGPAGRLATTGNLNNDIGVPLTLLGLRTAHRAAVVEMGMNHPGEMVALARIGQPTVALVNNAQREHQEFMASVDAVAIENAGVFGALTASGCAVFPHASPHAPIWRDVAGPRPILTFGTTHDADIHGRLIGADTNGMRMAVSGRVHLPDITVAALGEHNLLNALAAISCAHAAGIGAAAIVQGLADFTPVAGRLRLRRAGERSVIDDTYNANPDSVRAAIDVLAERPSPRVLVLGDMGEVGDQGEAFHAEIGRYARDRGIDQLICLGDATRASVAAFGPRATAHATFDALQDTLALVAPTASVLVKGSRFMRMERAVAALLGETSSQEAH